MSRSKITTCYLFNVMCRFCIKNSKQIIQESIIELHSVAKTSWSFCEFWKFEFSCVRCLAICTYLISISLFLETVGLVFLICVKILKSFWLLLLKSGFWMTFAIEQKIASCADGFFRAYETIYENKIACKLPWSEITKIALFEIFLSLLLSNFVNASNME